MTLLRVCCTQERICIPGTFVPKTEDISWFFIYISVSEECDMVKSLTAECIIKDCLYKIHDKVNVLFRIRWIPFGEEVQTMHSASCEVQKRLQNRQQITVNLLLTLRPPRLPLVSGGGQTHLESKHISLVRDRWANMASVQQLLSREY